MSTPLFSILHTSARPDKWRAVYDDWMSKAVHPENVEYVLCVDERWGFNADTLGRWPTERAALNHAVWNTGRRCYVDGVNAAAKASTGRILIVNADDQFAVPGWDEALIRAIDGACGGGKWDPTVPDGGFVIEVSTGTPSEHERGIMVMPILSRARYERLGYVLYPEYESMFADNEFCEHARQDGVVIDARHLMFEHRHWINGRRKSDAVDAAQNAPMASGRGILERRRAAKFATPKELAGKESAVFNTETEQSSLFSGGATVRPPVLAICTPGEVFREEFVSMLRSLDFFLQRDFLVQPVMGHATEPWRIRQEMADAIVADEWQPKADYVLWIDDDNLLTVEQFNMLYRALVDMKLDMVAGCCWIQYGQKEPYTFVPSFGYFNPEKNAIRYASAELLQKAEIVEAGFTGFPVVLMRREVLERAGKWCFRPILDDQAQSGLMGEDVSFCRRVLEAGGKIHVHTGVKVPHLKTRAIEPEYVVQERAAQTSEGERATAGKSSMVPKSTARPRIIGAMRVKNEGRWIKRCIESLFPLCDAVYVMDDHSSDNTMQEVCSIDAEGIGVVVSFSDSPFRGKPLDEARDKNWLLQKIRHDEQDAPPDYLLWIDGDEELEPGGAEKILQAIAANPETPAFNLRFYYLWNDTKTVRWDRWYSRVKRPSLFKNIDGVRFKSFYEGRGVHSGLHTSNCPFDLAQDAKDLDVFLIHYGYIFAKDRIAKYEYYNRIDPNNPMEDGYRHMVVGDVFSSDSTFLHSGPLELKALPYDIPPVRERDAAPSAYERAFAEMAVGM